MNNYQCKYVGCVFMFLCVRERDREKDKGTQEERLSVKVTVLGNTANHAGTTIKWWDCCRERQDWKDKMRDKTQVLLDWRYSLIKKTLMSTYLHGSEKTVDTVNMHRGTQ